MTCTNEFNQPIGEDIPNWTDRPRPGKVTISGRTCRLEPLEVEKHVDDLYAAYSESMDAREWTYLSSYWHDNIDSYREYIKGFLRGPNQLYAIIKLSTDKPAGIFALQRIQPEYGIIEVGRVNFSPQLRQTIESTEAHFLLMSYCFDELGYRRYEWKCDTFNVPSRKAALRLGFTFEGIFRQDHIYKGRNRDTAWFSIIDKEWPTLKSVFQAWLAPENFDNHGKQIKSLTTLKESLK